MYQKWPPGGLLPKYVLLTLLKKPNDPTRRSCNFTLSFPNHLMVETSSPDFHDFATAMGAVLKSGGYTYSGTVKNAVGRERDVWTGPNGSYTVSVSTQNAVVRIDIAPH